MISILQKIHCCFDYPRKPSWRYCLLLICSIMVSSMAIGQDSLARNRKPKIEGQYELSVKAGESITIQLTDLIVSDRDDFFYPWGFTLTVYSGSDYTLSNNTVTPHASFDGILTVPVTVNDG